MRMWHNSLTNKKKEKNYNREDFKFQMQKKSFLANTIRIKKENTWETLQITSIILAISRYMNASGNLCFLSSIHYGNSLKIISQKHFPSWLIVLLFVILQMLLHPPHLESTTIVSPSLLNLFPCIKMSFMNLWIYETWHEYNCWYPSLENWKDKRD